MKFKKTYLPVCILTVCLLLNGCGGKKPDDVNTGSGTEIENTSGTPVPVPAGEKKPDALSAAGIAENTLKTYTGDSGLAFIRTQIGLKASAEVESSAGSSSTSIDYDIKYDTASKSVMMEGSVTGSAVDGGISITTDEKEGFYSDGVKRYEKVYFPSGSFQWVEDPEDEFDSTEKPSFSSLVAQMKKGAFWKGLDSAKAVEGTLTSVISLDAEESSLENLIGLVSEDGAAKYAELMETLTGTGTYGSIKGNAEITVSSKTGRLVSVEFTAAPQDLGGTKVKAFSILAVFSEFTGDITIPDEADGNSISKAEADAYVNGDSDYNYDFDYSYNSAWTQNGGSFNTPYGLMVKLKAKDGMFYYNDEQSVLFAVSGASVTNYDYHITYLGIKEPLPSEGEASAEEYLTNSGQTGYPVMTCSNGFATCYWAVQSQNDNTTSIKILEPVPGSDSYFEIDICDYRMTEEPESLVDRFIIRLEDLDF